jgi:predicted SAM-dependent methyltransferase
LLTIKKSGIPKKIKKESQDLIYSFNVLQHCSQKDRFEYFKQSYEKLKIGGIFIGGMFLETERNKDEKYWGVEDLNGRKYTHFFTQLTEVDTEDEFYNFVRSLGFKVFSQRFYQNYCAFVMIKI